MLLSASTSWLCNFRKKSWNKQIHDRLSANLFRWKFADYHPPQQKRVASDIWLLDVLKDYFILSFFLSLMILSMFSFAHIINELIWGNKDTARSVKAYSTRGGTSGYIVRLTNPSSSSVRSVTVSIFCEISGIASLWNAFYQFALVCKWPKGTICRSSVPEYYVSGIADHRHPKSLFCP